LVNEVDAVRYEAELVFFRRLMSNMNIPTFCFKPDEPPEVDRGLRRILGLSESSAGREVLEHLREMTIFTAVDGFNCSYSTLLLPESGEVLLIGPYLRTEMTDPHIITLLQRHHLPEILLFSLRQYYATITYVENEKLIQFALATLGEILWGGSDSFTVEYMESADSLQMSAHALETVDGLAEAVDIQLLEARYDAERRLMYAVAHGQVHQAQLMISHAHESILEHRVPDTVRSLRNYGIVLNTLLRKAAEQGSVHPVHIDRLSSLMARRLEALHTTTELLQFFSTMVHKYCLLVKNHSMQSYSQLVQHVILRIETNPDADLSLKAHAEYLNVNASYLSTLFKKETGVTLTEFVNRSRIDQAIFLLNTTDLQIQSVAQNCGIPDVNYFTKLFKRMIGKTPKEYRMDTRRMVTER